MPCGYELKEGERVFLKFRLPEECPIVGSYLVRVMEVFDVRDKEGRVARNFLEAKVE